MSEEKKPNIFDVLGPGKTFLAGFIAALLVFFAIGFFVVIAKCDCGLMDKDNDDKIAFGNPTEQVDAVPTQPTNPGDQGGGVEIAPVTSDDYIRGDLTEAEVVIVEFSDFDCPFCSRFHPTMKQILSDYDGKVAWAYRHFPLDSLHPNARTKAAASECAGSLGGNDKFWEYTDILYDDTRKISVAQLGDVASEIGLNKTEFQACLDSGEMDDEVEADYQDSVASGGRGTPYSVVMTRDGQKIPLSGALPVSEFKAVIDPLLQ